MLNSSLSIENSYLDFLYYEKLLSDDEMQKLSDVKHILKTNIAPLAQSAWDKAEFPVEFISTMAQLDAASLTFRGYSNLLNGFIAAEFTKVDASIATFYGVHDSLFLGSIERLASQEQKERWLPDFRSWKKIGAFALTEPEGGSDISLGMRTSARREGNEWVINGRKRWIGNGTLADYCLVWARDEADGRVKAFMVDTKSEGYRADKIENKIALRTVQNADIVLDNVRVFESDRLSGANSFKDTNKVLCSSRVGVAWQTVGLQLAAVETTREYIVERSQFGKPLASFQIVQDKLVRMLGNVTASFGMLVRVSQLQDLGECSQEHAALAKSYNSKLMRETVALGRELFGGNGIVTDYNIAKIFADAEAIYSYEGTYEINTLLVGKSVTGISAFV